MKRLFLIPILTLLCSVMTWGANLTLGPGGDFTSTVAQAGAGGTITLTGNVTATPQMAQNPYVMVMPNASPITINLAGYTLDFSSCPLMQMMSTVNFTGAGEATGSVLFSGSNNNLNFTSTFSGTANITMSTNSGGTINIQGTSGLYSESIKNFPSLTLPSGKKLAKLRDCDTYYSVVDNAYETQSCVVAEPVAQIGETQYTSLETAFAEATDGSTIQLLDNVVMDYEDDEESDIILIEDGRDITLDLNGYNITGKLAYWGKPLISLQEGSLTIQGTGEFNVTEKSDLGVNAVSDFNRIFAVSPYQINGIPFAKLYLQGGSFALEPIAAYVPECYQVDQVSVRYVVSATPGCETLKAFLEKEGTYSRTISADYDISDKGVIYVNGNKTITIASGVTLYYKRQDGYANIIVNSGATLNVLGNGTMRPVANADPESEDNIWHNAYLSLKAQYDATTDKVQKEAFGAQMQGMYNGNRAIDVNGTLVVGVKDDANNKPHFITTSISRGSAVMVNAGGVATFNNADIDAAHMTIKNYGNTTINGGRYVSSSTTQNGVNSKWYTYNVVNGDEYNVVEGVILTINDGDFIGVHGAVTVAAGAIGYINGGNFSTVYGTNIVTGQPNTADNHYALYVATMAVVDVHGGNFKVQTPSAGGNRVILIGDNDAGTTFGVINFYGGTFQQKPYLSKRKAQDQDMIYPASVPPTSQWYSSFGTNVPLPAGYEYFEIIASGTPEAKQVVDAEAYAAGYRYRVVCTNPETKDVEEPADPTATIPWQRNTTWSDSNVPEKTTIVTIPNNRTVIVSSAEADKVAEAEQVFVNQGATLIVEGGTTMHIGDGGINVANGGKIIVKEGAVATVGASGIVTTDPEAISIETTEDNSAVFMIDPAVTENTRPKASVSVKTTAKQIRTAPYEYIWENIASPTMEGVKPENDWSAAVQGLFAGESSFVSAVYTWNSAANTWNMLSKWIEMVPFKGYQLTNNSANGGVTYTFKGNLVGNGNGTYDFLTNGYDYFGNSYTAPIVIATFLNALDKSVYERTVWLYDPGADTYIDINPFTAQVGAKSYKKTPTEPITEIRSLQAFILNKVGSGAAATVNYNDAIWSNPRIQGGGGGAPARKDISGINFMNLSVAAGSRTEHVMLVEGSQFTSAFDNGSDATKYMNKSGMNFYANTADAKLSTLASDNLAGTVLSFSAGDETSYTLTFTEVTAENYILRDLVSGKTVPVVEGNTYTFSQTAGTTVDARFVLEVKANAPTAVDAVNSDMTMWVSDNTLFVKGNVAAAPVSVIASNGMEVMRADAVNAAMQTVDLSGLAAGAYIIRVGDALLKAVK